MTRVVAAPRKPKTNAKKPNGKGAVKTNGTLAHRVEQLELEVADLRARLTAAPPAKDWRRTIGMFSNDPVMKEIDEFARRYREADRRRGRGGSGRAKT